MKTKITVDKESTKVSIQDKNVRINVKDPDGKLIDTFLNNLEDKKKTQ